MQYDLPAHLIQSAAANLDSPEEWENAQLFFYEALSSVHTLLPSTAQVELSRRGSALPTKVELEASRVALWKSIEHDRMGKTPEGSAVRATLFAFFPSESEGPLDAIAYFCQFFGQAGLPQEALIQAFRRQWPQHAT